MCILWKTADCVLKKIIEASGELVKLSLILLDVLRKKIFLEKLKTQMKVTWFSKIEFPITLVISSTEK